MNSDFLPKVIMLIVALHFVIGFGYLVFKLSPKKGAEIKDEEKAKDLE